MLISCSCVRELPCDLLLSSTVLRKKKKEAASWLEAVRKQACREREIDAFARTRATPSRQHEGPGSEAKRPPQTPGKKENYP